MTMQDLKSLIQQMETRRKMSERRQIILSVSALALILTGIGITYALQTPKTAPVTQAPQNSAYQNVIVSAKAAVVYDLTTGQTLYEKNAEAQLPLASLTKLLTLYAATDALAKNAPVTVRKHEADGAPADMQIPVGESFSFSDLARIALVASSNDAADAIATAAAKAQEAPNTTALLANAASALGLSQTYALNGSGLDENGTISGAYGSALDIAKLAGGLLKRAPDIARASINPTLTVTALSGRSYTLANTNPDVRHIPGLLLSKTGYTDLAGGNLAVVFDAGVGHPVAVVVLGSTRDDRFLDVNRLVEATREQFAGLTLSHSL